MATKFPEKTKKCARKTCLKTKPVSEFPHDKREKGGFSVWCKQCWRDYRNSRTNKPAPAAIKKGAVKKAVAKVSPVKKAAKPAKEVN